MAALNRATKASYVIHDRISAETTGECMMYWVLGSHEKLVTIASYLVQFLHCQTGKIIHSGESFCPARLMFYCYFHANLKSHAIYLTT